MNSQNFSLKRMGVINITPNSFSDGGESFTPDKVRQRFLQFGEIEALDIGAESTAPMNDSISWKEEWERLKPCLKIIGELEVPVSIDTYHPETIRLVAETWKKEKFEWPLIWNDVSGKFDHHVKNFLSLDTNFKYIFCHNLAPIRELSGKHMDYLCQEEDGIYIDKLASYFRPYIHPQVIFDPTLGFSKTYEQNWLILEKFGELQKKVRHDQWLLGFSRKSFIRKKLGLQSLDAENKEILDQYHIEVLNHLKPQLLDTVWIRTHRPELINQTKQRF